MEPGARIGSRYEIRAVGGRSWMGQRYRARDLDVDIEVALLSVNLDLLPDRDGKRVLPQLLRLKSLQSPQLVRLYDAFVDATSGALYLVEPWLEAAELRKYLLGMQKRREVMQPEELIHLVQQLVNGLDYAHRSGLLVPELSSETVFIDGSGLRIAGVGYAQVVGQERLRERFAELAGERALPPELLFGQPATIRTDVYRLAQLIVELARRAPLQKGEPPLVQSLDEPHRGLTAPLERALSADAELRPESPMALCRSLWPDRFAAPDLSELDATAPVLRIDPPALGSTNDIPTREIDALELRRIQGRDVTRRASDEELFPHRVLAAQPSGALFDERAANIALQSQSPIADLVADRRESTKVGRKPGAAGGSPPPSPPGSRAGAPTDVIDDEGSKEIEILELPASDLESEDPSKEIEIGPASVAAQPSPASTTTPPSTRRAPAVNEDALTAPRVLATPEELREASGPFAIPSPPVRAEPFRDDAASAPPPPSRGPRALAIAGGMAAVALIGLVIWAWPLLFAPQSPSAVTVPRGNAPDAAPPVGDLASGAASSGQPIVTKPDVPSLTAPPPSPAPSPSPSPSPAPQPVGWCPEGMQIISGVPRVCIDKYEYPGKDQLPKVGVSLPEAGQLCARRGYRLCRDAEWEAACRGHKGASYPYGGAHDAKKCNETKDKGLAPSGSFGECVSASEAYDMSGNAAEWVSSGNVRGGAAGWGSPRCSQIGHAKVEEGHPLVGFRCCSDLPE